MSGLVTDAFEEQFRGTPNWWLALHNVIEEFDEGDGYSAFLEYLMDTDPNDPDSFLQFSSCIAEGRAICFTFTPASSRRFYTLLRKSNMGQKDWLPVPGQAGVRGKGGSHTLIDTNQQQQAVFSVKVEMTP